MSTKDYYSILGVPRTVSHEELQKAFRKLVIAKHPDRYQASEGTPDHTAVQQEFLMITEAYNVLSQPDKRQQYDGRGSASSGDQQNDPVFYMPMSFSRGTPLADAFESYNVSWFGFDGDDIFINRFGNQVNK